MEKELLKPILEIGSGREGTLISSYENIVSKIFEPNVTKLDDPDKVKASWGFIDNNGRKAFIWCYKYKKPKKCFEWSIDGNMDLLKEIFGDDQIQS
jgi:hypothetical protein